MTRYLMALLACLVLAQAAWPQDPAEEDAQTAETEESAEADASDIDDSDLDEQVYEDVDDDFRPSEEISTDQSIAFPTDI